MKCSLPSRQMVISSLEESALTTDTPTPCKPARHLVGILVELPAGMELRHDHFGGGDAFALVDLGRDAAAVILDRHRAVGVQRHQDLVAEAGQRLVDGVVDHLIDHVVQARAVVGVADIHARPLAHGIEAFQHLDRTRRRIRKRLRLCVLKLVSWFPGGGCWSCRRGSEALVESGPDLTPIHRENLGVFCQRSEQIPVGSGHPGLGGKP